jgi:2'-5' RNA ligase
MNHFLGFFPDEKSNYKIRTVVGEVGRIFKDFDIPVRWVKPESFHITLYFLGEDFSFLDRLMLKQKFKKISFKPFDISLGKVKLGISKKYKELVYIDVNEGGEELRAMLLDLRKNLKGKDRFLFVPHLTIGRVSKDLSMEEYRNLVKDIHNVTKGLKVKDIKFRVDSLYLVKSDEGNYSLLMKFDAKSNMLE